MNIRKISYNKRVMYKIRSGRSPLIMGRRDGAENRVKWTELNWFLGFENLGASSEKGCSRKHTENWVTSWRILFGRNLRDLC
jgi:hypothetical protein